MVPWTYIITERRGYPTYITLIIYYYMHCILSVLPGFEGYAVGFLVVIVVLRYLGVLVDTKNQEIKLYLVLKVR